MAAADGGCNGTCKVSPTELAMLPFDPAGARQIQACSQFDARQNAVQHYTTAYIVLRVLAGVATLRAYLNATAVALGATSGYPLTGYGWSTGVPNATQDAVPGLVIAGNPVLATSADTDATSLGRYSATDRMLVVHGLGARIGQPIEATTGTTVSIDPNDMAALERYALERFSLLYQAADSLFGEPLGPLVDFSPYGNDSTVPGGRGHPGRLRTQLWLRGTTPGVQQTDQILVQVAGGGFTFAAAALVPNDDYYLPVRVQLFSTLAAAVAIAG